MAADVASLRLYSARPLARPRSRHRGPRLIPTIANLRSRRAHPTRPDHRRTACAVRSRRDAGAHKNPVSSDQLDELLADAGAADPQATRLQLVELGFLEATSSTAGRNDPNLMTSIAGVALAKARIGAPMTRAKAEAVLADVLRRAREVNEDPAALWWVEQVELFGSLTDPSRGTVGDVDLRILLSARHDADTHFELTRHAAKTSGRKFNTIVDQLGYAWLEMCRRVRGRSNRADIQFDEGAPRPLPPGATTVELYRRDGEPAASPMPSRA